MRIGHITLGMFALLGLLLMPFSTVVSQTAEQETAVEEATTLFAPGAPHGDWQSLVEPVTFYMDGERAQTPSSQEVPSSPSPVGFASTRLTYADPGNAMDVRITEAETFAMPVDESATEATALHRIDVRFAADCVSSATTLNPSVDISVSGIDFEPSEPGTQDASETVAAPGGSFTATFDDLADGLTLPAGTPLVLTVAPGASTLSCQITVGDSTSAMVLHTASAALSIWPAAPATPGNPGAPIRSVPHASSVLAGQRNFQVHIAYSSIWPCLNGDDGNASTENCGGSAHPASDAIKDAFDAGRIGLRVRNIDTAQVQSAGLNHADPVFTPIGDSVDAITYSFSYSTSFETSSTPGKGDFRFEIFTKFGHVISSDIFSVGGKGIDFSVRGDADREINVGQPTTYRLNVDNVGTERDVVKVRLSGDDARWGIQVFNDQATVEPGSSADVVVRVTPPGNAIPGDILQMTASAASSFPNEVTIAPLHLSVELVEPVTTGATLTGGPGSLELLAGDDLDLSGFSIENTGTKVGTYVIETSFEPAAEDWRAEATPPSRTIDAASVEDFSIGLTISRDAAPGQAHTLIVEARLLGANVPPGARVEVPITIIFEAGLEVSVRDAERSLRDDASTDNNPDTDFDPSAVFRVTLTNPTAVDQSFAVTNVWPDEPDPDDEDPCGEGSPATQNGWRIALWDGNQSFQNPVDTLSGQTIMVPGSERLDTWVVLQWLDDDDLPDGCSRADSQEVTLRFRSEQDGDVSESVTLTGDVVVGGENQGSHVPTLEPERHPDGSEQKTQVSAVRHGAAFDPAVFRFVVVNDGNEHDGYTIQLPLPPDDDWTHELFFLEPDETKGVMNAGSVVHGIDLEPACSKSSNGRVLTCDDVGVGDHLLFEMEVTPPSNEPLGQTMTSSVIVSSRDDPDKKAEHNFRTRTAGVNDFAVESLRGVSDAAQGTNAALPFSIQNIGTANDQFTLALTAGDDAWSPRFAGSIGSQQEISVPGVSDYNGFLLVEAPVDDDIVGSGMTFIVTVASKTTGQTKTVELRARVVASNSLAIGGENGNNVLLQRTGQSNDVAVVFEAPDTASCTSATIAVDIDALPEDWRVASPTSRSVDLTTSGSTKSASATFQVTPPVDTLGTSSTAMRVTGTCGSDTVYADLVLSVEVASGVDLSLVSPQAQFVSPGAPTRWDLDVINTGLDADTIILSTTVLPQDWSVTFESQQVAIGPIATLSTTFDVNAPADAEPKSNVTFNVLATSQADPSVIQQVTVSAIVGFREITLSPNGTEFYGAPEEKVAIVVPVTNDGTLSDRIALTAEVQTPGYSKEVLARTVPETVELLRGQSRDVLLNVELGRNVPAEVRITIAINATSLFSTIPVNATADVDIEVLGYQRADVDGDLVDEYSVDRNRDDSDGFEEFRESSAPGGRTTTVPDLARFLSEDAVSRLGLGNGAALVIDGDEDGKVDHFLDDTGDGLPSIYWDPDDEQHMRLDIVKDVDADSVPDYFVDLDDDDILDRVYNLVTGEWTDLIVIEGEGDRISYIVDSDGNGQADPDESVLVIASGRVARVTVMVDMDGDKRLDTVVDSDGDDEPDFFIRAGETRERAITLQDVNGDGIEDWTFDSNLDGRNDAYYDPATQTGGHSIDHTQGFMSLAAKYWFVPALFLVVLVLFIVLIVVTRR